MSFLRAVGNLAGSVLGIGIRRKVDQHFERDTMRHRYKTMRGLGFTHTEMAGGAGTSTLGNGPQLAQEQTLGQQAALQRRQHAHEQTLKDKDVAVATAGQGVTRRGQDIEDRVRTEANAIARAASQNLDARERSRISREWQEYRIARERGDREAVTQSAAFILHRALLGMGPENLRASFLAIQFKQEGIDLVSPEGQLISQEDLRRVLNELRAEGSTLYRELTGVGAAVDQIVEQMTTGESYDIPQQKGLGKSLIERENRMFDRIMEGPGFRRSR